MVKLQNDQQIWPEDFWNLSLCTQSVITLNETYIGQIKDTFYKKWVLSR